MAIARRTSASVTRPTSSSSYPVTWSTVPTDGDLMVAVIGGGVQTTITAPAGWTLRGTQDVASALRSWLYTRTASSEPSTNTWTLGSATKGFGWVGAYSGVDLTSLVFGSNGSLVTSKIVVPAGGWMISAGLGKHIGIGVATTWTSNDDGLDSKMVDFGSNVLGSNDIDGCVYDTNRALLGSVYNRILKPSNVEASGLSFAVAFAPASGVPATPARIGAGINRWGVSL